VAFGQRTKTGMLPEAETGKGIGMVNRWFERQKFRWLIYIVYLLIRIAAKRSRRMREKLQEKNIAVVMQSKDKITSRTIRSKDGKVYSRTGESSDAVSQIVWAEPEAGSRVIMKLIKGERNALMQALIDKDLLPQGDAGGIRWFLDVVGLLNKVFYGKKRSSKQ
jgi:hypothetical protein